MTQVITTENLTKKYKNFIALNKVSMHVSEGDIYGLIGKNGAGKTTLFKLLMGLANPTSGKMLIGNSADLDKARSNIGFMIGPSFFSYLSARENIEYYRKIKGIHDKAVTDRVLDLVELKDVKKPFKVFSMGMKQRLGIANALLGNPPIIILDEPINGLDPQGISDVRNIIKKIHEKQQTTFVISSHILSELDLVATRFGFIDHGELLKELTYDDLHQHTNSGVVIKVNNVDEALNVLYQELKIEKYKISANQEIILNGYEKQTDQIAKVLIHSGLKLYSLKNQEMTLEDYFIQLIGGGANV